MSDLEVTIPAAERLTTRTVPDPKDFFTERLQVKRADRVVIPNSWDKVAKIPETRNQPIDKPEDLVHIVETPLLPSAIAAAQAGMITCESNASFDPYDKQTTIFLSLRWDSLNKAQQARAKELIQADHRWRLIKSEDHGDNYDALCLQWEINRQTSPIQVHHDVFHGISKIIGQSKQPSRRITLK